METRSPTSINSGPYGSLDGAAHPAPCLRREQFTALATRSTTIAVCSLGSCAVIMAAFWQDGPHGFLLAILAALALLHGVEVQRSRAWLAGPRTALSGFALSARVLNAALIAATYATMLFVLMPTASADQKQLLVYVFSGLTTSGLVISSVLPAAIATTCVAGISMLAVMPLLHQTISAQHALMVLLFSVMTMIATCMQNREFRRRFENETTMQEQKDTIALLLRDFQESAGDWLWRVDAQFRLIGSLDRFRAATGCSEETLSTSDLRSFLDRDAARRADEIGRFLDAVDARLPFRGARLPFLFDGTAVWLCLSGRPVVEGGRFLGYQGVASNVTEVQRSTDRIAYLARYDSLTGLPNRTLFQESLLNIASQTKGLALLCLDLDGFKAVNDTYGHGTGDELLVMVARRLRGCVREGDAVCRLGGDEFAILASLAADEVPSGLAARLIEVIARPFTIRDLRVSISLCVGIVMVRGDNTAEQLMQAGDIALHAAKRGGRGSWSLFEQSMADATQERHLLEGDLRDAIDGGGLELAFQPIVDVRDRRVICVEALARWTHPGLGPIPPDRFIALAEANGLIVPLGAWVLRRACLEASRWPDEVRVAVNLSPLQMKDPGLLSVIDAALNAAALPPARLEIEITESVLVEDVAGTLERLQLMRARGVRISLDDFGTGYSSLSYLRSFPFDKVKIDRSFVRDIGESAQALSIVRAIVGMASSLDMHTTAEGVETAQQARLLEMAGCDQFQGFLFGRPCAQRDIADGIRMRNAAVAALSCDAARPPVS